mmetsp:Transcript_5327/g.10960  ORF Transcript_5327/g.10960 Transcript_5327/m.10960 type:complete len:83 (+) Transcript_5327:860-1108(+)
MGSPKFLPVTPLRVVTPVDEAAFEGVTYQRRIVGVSIIRAGEAMETACVMKLGYMPVIFFSFFLSPVDSIGRLHLLCLMTSF